MKRFLSILLSVVMCATLLLSAPALADEEPYAVQLLLPTMQAIPAEAEIKLVEDAINDHIKNDLGITDIKMDLRFESLFTYTDTTGMGLASNERYDIIFPDDALSHCRRLGEIIAMNAICPPNVHTSLPGEATSHDNESMENNDEHDFE